MYRIFLISIILTILVGCGPKRENVAVIVEDVRITSVIQESKSKGNPIGGAIVGGLIAGGAGAVVGYAVESEEREITVWKKISGCKFTVIEPKNNHRISFTISNEYEQVRLTKCSLLRKGDEINLEKLVFNDEEIKIIWDSPYYLEGEILNY